MINLKYNLNNNSDLINFFNELFRNEDLTQNAPLIMKFFIITRNYGFIDYEENINKIIDGYNFTNLCLETIKKGFIRNNIEFNNENIISLLINNYHENGFYFYSFPGIYKDSIKEFGLLINNHNLSDQKYNQITEKYHFGSYFENNNNSISVTEMKDNYNIIDTLYAPEWLEMFLKQGNQDIRDAFRKGDTTELDIIADNALAYWQNGMKRNELYNENDFIFLCSYIKDVINKRFRNGNNEIGVALIEKSKASDYFKKEYIKSEDAANFNNFTTSKNMDYIQVFDFIINLFTKGKVTSDKSIPNHLINIVSYQLNDNLINQTNIK